MPAINFLGGAVQLFDANGNPLAQGKIQTYAAGTSTPKASYPTQADAVALTNANANPTILDAVGRGNIWLNGLYKVVVKDAADNTIYTTDNLGAAPGRVVAKTTGYTVALSDAGDTHACSHATGFTVTLPAAASAGAGFAIGFACTGEGAIVLDGNGAETINGSATLVLGKYETAELVCDGSNWFAAYGAGLSGTEVVINDAGADRDLRVEGDTDPNLITVDAGNNRVGIGGVPSTKLHVFGGEIRCDPLGGPIRSAGVSAGGVGIGAKTSVVAAASIPDPSLWFVHGCISNQANASHRCAIVFRRLTGNQFNTVHLGGSADLSIAADDTDGIYIQNDTGLGSRNISGGAIRLR